MKKFLALSAAVAIVASLQANTIEWSLPALTDGTGNAIDYTLDDIVFISTASPTSYDSTSGKITGTTPSGSNTKIDGSEPGDTEKYLVGLWEDSLTGGGDYYMAYKGSDGTFYALAGDSGAVTVTAPASSDPLIPHSGSGKVFLDSSDTVKTVAPAVPEPATAVLALAGIAMLIRRRKA